MARVLAIPLSNYLGSTLVDRYVSCDDAVMPCSGGSNLASATPSGDRYQATILSSWNYAWVRAEPLTLDELVGMHDGWLLTRPQAIAALEELRALDEEASDAVA